MNTEYHWIADNEFPKEEGEYWCWKYVRGGRSKAMLLYYFLDLYELDNSSFEDYKGQYHGGFCEHNDIEQKWREVKEVNCWANLLPIPEELTRRKNCATNRRR